MRTRLAVGAAVCALASSFSKDASAAGYALDVLSGRGTGMAGATAGFIDDSSAIFFNAAGIAQVRGIDAQVGLSPIVASFKYTSLSGQSTTTPFKIIPPPHAYFAAGITDHLSAGVGVYTQYGLIVQWPDAWAGRSIITKAQLATYDINPTVAYSFGPVRVGAGVDVIRAAVDLNQDIALPGQYGSAELGAATWGVGGNLGVQVDAIPKTLSFGAQYRSTTVLNFDGNAHFSNIPTALASTIHDQAVSTRVVLPDTFQIGAAVRPSEKLVLDLDLVYYGWQYLHSVDLRFPNDASGSLSKSTPKNWNSTLNYHLGGEYTFDETWQARAGAILDPSPSPDETTGPDIPDASRLNLAVGGSWHHSSGVRVDLGYQFLILFKRHSTLPGFSGDYGGFVNLLGISIGYSSKPEKPAPLTPAPQ